MAINIGTLEAIIRLKDELSTPLQGIDKKIGGMSQTLLGLGKALGIGFGAVQVVSFGKAIFDDADALVKLSDKTAISIGGLQRLRTVGDDAGNSLEELTGAVSKMQVNLGKGDETLQKALVALGLSVGTLKALAPEQQFMAIVDAIRLVRDPTEQARLAVEIFGRSGTSILPTIKQGFDDVKDASIGMSAETVRALDRLGDGMTRLGKFMTALGGEVIAFVIKPFADVATVLAPLEKTLKTMATNAEQAAPKIKAIAPPGLPKDLRDIYDALENQHEALKRSTESAKKFAEEYKKSTADVKALERNFFGLWETVGLVNERELTFIKTSIKLNEQVKEIENSAHIANFGFKGMIRPLQDVGVQALETKDDLADMQAMFGMIGPELEHAGKDFDSLEEDGRTLQSTFGDIAGVLSTVSGGFVDMAQIAIDAIEGITKSLSKGDLVGAVVATVTAIGRTLSKIFGRNEEATKVNPMRDAFFEAAGGLHEMNVQAHAAGVTLDAVLRADTVKEYELAIRDLNAAIEFQDQAMRTLDETVERYGFTLEELGPTLQRQRLSEQAQQLYQDFNVLISAGIDVTAVTGRMAESINDYVHKAITMGQEVPEAMRPMLEQMAKMGLLTDEAGNVITDLESSGITFSETMTEGFTRVVDEVRRLTDAIMRGLGLALDDTIDRIARIPRTIPVDIQYNYPGYAPPVPGPGYGFPGYQRGTGGRFVDFGRGMPVMLHGRERVQTESEVSESPSKESRTGILAELRGLRRDMTFLLPGTIARATTVALVKAGVG